MHKFVFSLKKTRARGPYQLTEFPDHHFPINYTDSFPLQPDVLKFLHSYADRFGLNKYIKFNHLVIRVHPIENGKWEVIVKDLSNDRFITSIYDAVFVCNGHYFAPHIAKIEDSDLFKGKVLHSHDFRRAEAFRGKFEILFLVSLSNHKNRN